MRKVFVTAVLVVGLSGCAGTSEKRALVDDAVARDVAAARQILTTVERAALRYTSLPPCGTNPSVACADPVKKEMIKRADRVAYDAVMRARRNEATLTEALIAIDELQKLIP